MLWFRNAFSINLQKFKLSCTYTTFKLTVFNKLSKGLRFLRLFFSVDGIYAFGYMQKMKYRGMFETHVHKSGNKTSSGEIGLDIKKTCKSQSGTGPGVRRSKLPLLACCTRCKCSTETSQN